MSFILVIDPENSGNCGHSRDNNTTKFNFVTECIISLWHVREPGYPIPGEFFVNEFHDTGRRGSLRCHEMTVKDGRNTQVECREYGC